MKNTTTAILQTEADNPTALSSILAKLRGHTHTLGWDVVMAWQQTNVNRLFAQEYANKLALDQHYRKINETIKLGSNGSLGSIQLKDFVLGMPQISFEQASLRDSTVTVTLAILDALIFTRTNTSHCIAMTQVNPQNGAKIVLKVPLTQVVSDLKAGKIKLHIHFNTAVEPRFEGETELPADVKEYFKNFFQKNRMTYEIGDLRIPQQAQSTEKKIDS